MGKLKDLLGLSIAGALKGHIREYRLNSSKRWYMFDPSKVDCVVSGEYYSAYCYCNDPNTVAQFNWLRIFSSKTYKTREEAEAALDLDIIHASRIHPNSKFYRERYYSEHDAVGESLCCVNEKWIEEKNRTEFICPCCGTHFSSYPEDYICNNCCERLI